MTCTHLNWRTSDYLPVYTHLCGNHQDKKVECNGEEIRKLSPTHIWAGEKRM